MPVYLLHGFRWARAGFTGIRVHAIQHNLEDCSVEYIQNEDSQLALLQSFGKLFPDAMQHLNDARLGKTIQFIEQYDPEDEASDVAVSQPHAFVADRVITIAASKSPLSGSSDGAPARQIEPVVESQEQQRATTTSSSTTTTTSKPRTGSSSTTSHLPSHKTSALSLNIEEAMSAGPALTPQAWEALAQLRDKIAEGEKIGWWIVYNGDPERAYSDDGSVDTPIGYDGEGYELDDSHNKSQVQTHSQPGSMTKSTSHTTEKKEILGQPLPSIIPPNMKHVVPRDSDKDQSNVAPDEVAVAIPHPPQEPRTGPIAPPSDSSASQSKANRSNFSFPLRRKSSKSNVSTPRGGEVVEDPAALKEISRKEGRRHRFFGGRSEKKDA